MRPNVTSMAARTYEEEQLPVQGSENDKEPSPRKIEYVWRNIISIGSLHVVGLYGFYFMFTSAQIQTILFAVLLYLLGVLGITGGAHRLWAHRAYKAKWPLRVFLMLCNTLGYQGHVIQWAREHRMHHKYSETDADPHNARRGFFFSHVGWLFVRKHPQVLANGHNISVQDLISDPILYFQRKYYFTVLMPLITFIVPTLVPMYFWNETLLNASTLNVTRYILSLNSIWLVNSVAHMFGDKPYDKTINPVENIFVAILAMGEGWHNYHHTFPWDYKISEFSRYSTNLTTAFIDLMAILGQAYELKTVSEDVVQKRVKRTGDGSHVLWGSGETNKTAEHKEVTVSMHKKGAELK